MARILLVDDDARIRSIVREYAQAEDWVFDEAGDGEEALRLFSAGNYALVLLDVMMPRLDGWGALKQMRKISQVPVILLTARNEEYDRLLGFELGVDDYIAKPFRLRELLSRVRTVLRRVGGVEKDEISIGDLTIYVKQAKVTKNGVEIPFTALEYQLLLTLATIGGQLLTRSRLLEDFCDIDGDFVNDNTLTVYIKRLREKIEDDPQNPVFIQTIRGLGYRMGT